VRDERGRVDCSFAGTVDCSFTERGLFAVTTRESFAQIVILFSLSLSLMASLFAQFMSSADDAIVEDSGDLDWSAESSNSEASTEDFAMDVEDAELNAEAEAAEEEDEYYVNLHVLACCKKEGSWVLEALNWDDDISQVSFRLSKRVEISAYQIYRLIQRNLPLSPEFQHGFRIYVDEHWYFQHDGKGDGAGTGMLQWFTLELFNEMNDDLGQAKRFYGKGMKFGFLQRETLAGETLNFSVVVTPYNETLPTGLTLRYEDAVIEHVSPFCSLYDFHLQQQQKEEEEDLWEPPYPLSRCYNFRTPLAALGWKVQ
jgi:hypothetical protein